MTEATVRKLVALSVRDLPVDPSAFVVTADDEAWSLALGSVSWRVMVPDEVTEAAPGLVARFLTAAEE